MLTDIREINRILLAINEIGLKDASAKKNAMLFECKNIVLGGKISNHEDTIDFCISCKIIEEDGNVIKLTNLGKELCKLNSEKNWELNNQQKKILIENCFLDGCYKQKTIDFLKQFYSDNKRQTFVFSYKNGTPLYGNFTDIKLLKQVGLILEEKDFLLVNPEYSEYVSYLKNSKSKMTDEELERKLKKDKKIGKIAEKIVLEYEKKRLKSEEKALPESDIVQIISGTDVGAGYDIESFDGKTEDLEFNRHIEVKGSTGKELSFFWSSGEIEKAKEKKSSYWIYFVPRINVDKQTYDGEINKIQNPAYEILETKNYNTQCIKIHVTKN